MLELKMEIYIMLKWKVSSDQESCTLCWHCSAQSKQMWPTQTVSR